MNSIFIWVANKRKYMKIKKEITAPLALCA